MDFAGVPPKSRDNQLRAAIYVPVPDVRGRCWGRCVGGGVEDGGVLATAELNTPSRQTDKKDQYVEIVSRRLTSAAVAGPASASDGGAETRNPPELFRAKA